MLMSDLKRLHHLLAVTHGKSAKIEEKRLLSRSDSIAIEDCDLDIDFDDRNSAREDS